jgi:hypothetical protein
VIFATTMCRVGIFAIKHLMGAENPTGAMWLGLRAGVHRKYQI